MVRVSGSTIAGRCNFGLSGGTLDQSAGALCDGRLILALDRVGKIGEQTAQVGSGGGSAVERGVGIPWHGVSPRAVFRDAGPTEER